MADQKIKIFVPVVLDGDQILAVRAALKAVVDSFVEAGRPESEYVDLVEANKQFDDAFDRKHMELALEGRSEMTIGEVILNRVRRQLRDEK